MYDDGIPKSPVSFYTIKDVIISGLLWETASDEKGKLFFVFHFHTTHDHVLGMNWFHRISNTYIYTPAIWCWGLLNGFAFYPSIPHTVMLRLPSAVASNCDRQPECQPALWYSRCRCVFRIFVVSHSQRSSMAASTQVSSK